MKYVKRAGSTRTGIRVFAALGCLALALCPGASGEEREDLSKGTPINIYLEFMDEEEHKCEDETFLEGGETGTVTRRVSNDGTRHFLACRSVVKDDDWTRMACRFKATADGTLELQLKGAMYRPAVGNQVPFYVYADDCEVEVDGKPLDINGGLEAGDDEAEGWKVRRPGRLVEDASVAHAGKRCVCVSARAWAGTRIPLEKGKTYKVSAWFRRKADGLKPHGIERSFSIK